MSDHEREIADEEKPSKSQLKREMLALQTLGEALIELTPKQLTAVPLPDDLRDAIEHAQQLPSRGGARKRQRQFIGKLMREVDPAPIRQALDALEQAGSAATAIQHRAEQWRERLLTDDAAMTELIAQYPDADPQQLRQLVRNSRAEHNAGKPPKASRQLFRVLRTLLTELPASSPQHSA